jgi:hypothetical protein
VFVVGASQANVKTTSFVAVSSPLLLVDVLVDVSGFAALPPPPHPNRLVIISNAKRMKPAFLLIKWSFSSYSGYE